MIDVVLVASNELNQSKGQLGGKPLLMDVFNLLIAFSGPLRFENRTQTIAVDNGGHVVQWSDIFEKIQQFRIKQNIPAEKFIVLLMKDPNELDYFCHVDELRNIFIHYPACQQYSNADLRYPVVFQIAECVLEFFITQRYPNTFEWFHETPKGCINDFCGYKPDIMFKFRTADICSDCLMLIDTLDLESGLLEQLLAICEATRKPMLNSSINQAPDPFMDRLPFTVAIARRRFINENEPLRRMLKMIDYLDALFRSTVIMVGKVIYQEHYDEFAEEQGLNEAPTFGNWVNALSHITKQANEVEALILPMSITVFEKNLQEITRIANDRKIVKMRNDERGHGYIHCSDRKYQKMVDDQMNTINDIEQRLLPVLANMNCICVVEQEKSAIDKFKITYKRLCGDHPDFLNKNMEWSGGDFHDMPIRYHVYLWVGANQFIDLYPQIIFDHCPECDTERVLISDGKLYLDPYEGHRVEI